MPAILPFSISLSRKKRKEGGNGKRKTMHSDPETSTHQSTVFMSFFQEKKKKQVRVVSRGADAGLKSSRGRRKKRGGREVSTTETEPVREGRGGGKNRRKKEVRGEEQGKSPALTEYSDLSTISGEERRDESAPPAQGLLCPSL